MTPSLPTQDIRGIVLDIEGTTTPIAFVHEVLFAYAGSEVGTYLSQHFGSAELLDDLVSLRQEHAIDMAQNQQPPELVEGPADAEIEAFVAYIEWLIARDRKSRGLKSLQGKIWKQGYLDGTLKAPLYPDVPPAFERWRRAGLKISIFSSGSSLAQKLLFAHTEVGDLTASIDNYFDTSVGSKTDVESYRRISSTLGVPVSEMLFISDVLAELEAASKAGMHTRLCIRPGNPPQSRAEGHQIIRSFDEISV